MLSKQIKTELEANSFSFALIAEALDVTPAVVSRVASRGASSIRIAKAIAAAIGKPIEQVFPDVTAYHTGMSLRIKEVRDQKREELKQLFENANVA